MKQKYLPRNKSKYNLRFYKELIMATLAIISVGLVMWEYFMQPSADMRVVLNRIDIAIALVFLTDFCLMLARARNKAVFMKRNWYLLLASIPIVDSWAELLRGLRLLELVRLIRAGEHISYAYKSNKH